MMQIRTPLKEEEINIFSHYENLVAVKVKLSSISVTVNFVIVFMNWQGMIVQHGERNATHATR